MRRPNGLLALFVLLSMVVGLWGGGTGTALAIQPVTTPGMTPDYYETANWANSPALRKFMDGLPLLNTMNNLNQQLITATPQVLVDTKGQTYHYYEIEVVQYREQMHRDLPPVVLANGSKMDPATTGGTLLRGYRQVNIGGVAGNDAEPYYLGPVIVAAKDIPVRIKFINKLPTGNLFLPVDTSIMGAGEFTINYNPLTNAAAGSTSGNFTQNRANLHLHGGRSPWISDGTPHQWITPAGDASANAYPTGASVTNVPDMWFNRAAVDADNGSFTFVPACTGLTTATACASASGVAVGNLTNNPMEVGGIIRGAQTYYYTNQQSARLMFYHDHAWGITRLNVYAGMAAGYVITDTAEQAMVGGVIPADMIPLIIQDKTFVNAAAITSTDPTWAWGTRPVVGVGAMTPDNGDLWWPHVYMPAQNPWAPDLSGVNAMGRWMYGPWFWPPTPVCGSVAGAVPPLCISTGTAANPYYNVGVNAGCNPETQVCQPPEIPGTPNVSWGAEAFLDTVLVNGTAYPTHNVNAQKYRLRILNASHDRHLNLQFYQAVSKLGLSLDSEPGVPTFAGAATDLTEVRMVPASATAGFPALWPVDAREGGVPDPALRGPAIVQIGTEGGFLPQAVVLPNQPVQWNVDPTMFNVGNVLSQRDGGGTLMLGPAERADVIVDFTNYAGKTIILYNDAPAAWPALDPHYDYYSGAPDRTDIGGYTAIPKGVGPNVRTVMQFVVAGANDGNPVAINDDYDAGALPALNAALAGYFNAQHDKILVAQDMPEYEAAYARNFPKFVTGNRLNGLSRISDNTLSFQKYDGSTVTNFPMKPKAIHDEMGGTFDDFGRMSAKLGVEVPFANAAIANFVLQNYVDPSTEIIGPDEMQIWKITHNGVDTHPIHFHLFDVQVINRVGWDGFIRLPDSNELGWKETVRISPLEDTIVAMRAIKPRVPFAVPNSVRTLNPALPIGSTMGFTGLNPLNGDPIVTTNQVTNFGHEYVWHCHILSHEENDMMRPIIFNVNAKKELLWRNTSTGQDILWYLDGVTTIGSGTLPALADQNWKIVGRADFNSDGKLDILWRNTSTGQNLVWYMDGITRIGSGTIQGLADQNWKIVGTGDFNGDGKPDILWRNTSTGQNLAWYMNGVTFIGSGTIQALADQNWKIVATADFNDDGKTDIVWRNTSTGQNLVWFMNGVTRTASATLPVEATQAWTIVGAGDFNSNVTPDILWRNTANGQNRVWYVNYNSTNNTLSVSGTGALGTLADQNWKMVGN